MRADTRREYFYTLLVPMDSLLVSKSTHSFNNERDTSYDPTLDPYHETYEDMQFLLDELPSPPDSPRSESPPSPVVTRAISPEAKKLRKLLQIRKMLYSLTGSEIRDEVIQRCGKFTVPVHDHLNYKKIKKVRN